MTVSFFDPNSADLAVPASDQSSVVSFPTARPAAAVPESSRMTALAAVADLAAHRKKKFASATAPPLDTTQSERNVRFSMLSVHWVSLGDVLTELSDIRDTTDTAGTADPPDLSAEDRHYYEDLVTIARWLCARQGTHLRSPTGQCPICTGPTLPLATS